MIEDEGKQPPKILPKTKIQSFDPDSRYHYVVTLKAHDDLNGFYHDMERPSSKLSIPDRPIACKSRRPSSRNTDYELTPAEAAKLRRDPRVLAVEMHPSLLGAKFGPLVTQSSSYFNKSSADPGGNAFSTSSNVWINWGLLRVSEGSNRPGWGGNGNTMASGNVTINTTGRNVDVVICDSGTLEYGHPEYAVNADGSGGSRVVEFNWYQYNPVVNGEPEDVFVYSGNESDHSIHVAGTVAGNSQGWARGANIYAAPYWLGGGPIGAGDYCFDYIKQFHLNKPINPETGVRNPTVVNNSWGWSIFPGDWSFDAITQVTYRGVTYDPTGEPYTTGYSGICSSDTQYATLGNLVVGGFTITTSTGNASVASTGNVLHGTSGLSMSTIPTVGTIDDGYWSISLPFGISFLGASYSTVYMGTNWYLTFGGGSTRYASLGPAQPPLPKICISAGDRNITALYYGSIGSPGTRTYIIRVEGNHEYFNEFVNTIYEIWLYENDPSRIEVKVGENGSYTADAQFSPAQLNAWGFIEDKRIPFRVASIDADVVDCINAGVIMVGAAGNGSWKHDVPGGVDWDNTFMMDYWYPGEVYSYMKGTSPTANDNSMGMVNICVGAIGYTLPESKAYFSDCGPGVDLYSPGYHISSSLPYGATDPRNRTYYQGKLSGTSMASPQVCGVVACAMEQYPRWQQQDAKTWLLQQGTINQLTAGDGGPTDFTDLQGGENICLCLPVLVPTEGQVVPTQTYGNVPSTGQIYPRTRIFIYGS